MKFNDFKYERISFEEIKEKYENLLSKLKQAKQPEEFRKFFDEINVFRNHISTMMSLCSVRNSINTADEFYENEMNYWDNTSPKINVFENQFYKICLEFEKRDELNVPEVFFKIAEFSLKSFDERVLEEKQIENKLTTEYSKFMSNAKIDYEGKTYNIPSMLPFMLDEERSVRKKAYEAFSKFFNDNEEFFDDIYDKLVKNRDVQAKKMGYKNFVELGYYRMQRHDYDSKMVSNFRKQVVEEIVPVVKEIEKARAKRLGLEKLYYYDSGLKFKDGNPKPKGSEEELVSYANKMYHEMSKETGEFFDIMVDKQLFDLTSKENKQPGGYCTEFADYKLPFIFANFNGTSHDVDVLTHEAGHAFQSYMTALTNTVPECAFPTLETCEIHSVGMEFLTHPWMEGFFKEDTEKYYYDHIASSISFIPYGVLVDHFQHEVYEKPDMSKDERKAVWRKLEKMYLPTVDYADNDFLEKGTFWFKQLHIFQSPFYYIDYCLSTICALQIFNKTLLKDPNVWQDYLTLCKNGGTLSFLGNLKEANLVSPFEDNCIKNIIGNIYEELKKHDIYK